MLGPNSLIVVYMDPLGMLLFFLISTVGLLVYGVGVRFRLPGTVSKSVRIVH